MKSKLEQQQEEKCNSERIWKQGPHVPEVPLSIITVPIVFLIAPQANSVQQYFIIFITILTTKEADVEKACPSSLSSTLRCPLPPAIWIPLQMWPIYTMGSMIEAGLQFKGYGVYGGDWLREHEEPPAPYSGLQIKKKKTALFFYLSSLLITWKIPGV